MRAGAGRGFEDAGPQPLAAHLHQAKAGDAADLDAGAVVLQRVLHPALDLADVRSEEHKSDLPSLMRPSYPVFCLKKKHYTQEHTHKHKNTRPTEILLSVDLEP